MRARDIGLVCSVAFVVVNGFLPGLASAELKIETQTKYYEIEGRTGRQLFESLQENAPKTMGAQHLGMTETYLTWNMDMDEGEGECRLAGVDVTLELTYHMPRWQNREKARKKTIKDWEAFMEALWAHEEYHGHLAKIGAQSIHDSLIEHVDPAPDCKTVAEQFSDYARMQLKEVSKAQVQFDARSKINDLYAVMK